MTQNELNIAHEHLQAKLTLFSNRLREKFDMGQIDAWASPENLLPEANKRAFCNSCGMDVNISTFDVYGGQGQLDSFYGGYGGYYGGYHSRYPRYTPAVDKTTGKNYKSNKVVYQAKKKQVFKKIPYKVTMSFDIARFIQRMMFEYSIEWGVVFTYTMDKENKSMHIDRLYTFPVTASGGDVTYINESVYQVFAKHSDLPRYVADIQEKGRYAGIMHSHHTMGSWHSGTDLNCIDTFVQDFKNVLSLVWSKSGDQLNVQSYMSVITQKDGKEHRFNGDLSEGYEFPEGLTPENIMLPNEHYDNYKKVEKVVSEIKPEYDKVLKQFQSTKKYSAIKSFYDFYSKEENQELIKPFMALFPNL
jgi:hypothetical protein